MKLSKVDRMFHAKKDNLMMLHFVLEKITIWVHESETRDTCM